MLTLTQRQRDKLLKKLGWLLAGLLPCALILYGLSHYIQAYITPKELLALSPNPKQMIRLGAIVKPGSVVFEDGYIRFKAQDQDGTELSVVFTGQLPNLFKEGRVMLAEGYWDQGQLTAHRILAKHDENYQPKAMTKFESNRGHD